MNRLLIFLLGSALIASSARLAVANDLTDADRAFLEKRIIARWDITGKGQIEAAFRRGVDILEDHPSYRAGYFTILVDADELDLLRADGYKITVIEDDWYSAFAAKSSLPFGGFKTWSEGIAFLDSLHGAYPSITTAKIYLGASYEGRPIWGMKISDNPDTDESEPEILFDAVHHAREVITPEVLFETMRRLTFQYGIDPFITQMVNEREIYFVPYVNPDGIVYNEFIAPGGGGLWRKNRNDVFAPDYGVDPNRNYGDHWGFDDLGSSPDPASETYRGSAPFSEPETANMQVFINSRQFVIQMSYHSYSNLILWPPGYQEFYVDDHPLFAAIADSMAAFNGYLPEPIWGLYLTNGTAIEWSYLQSAEHPEILAFTPEVGSGGDGFWPDESRIAPLVEENQGPNFVVIELADQPERIFPPVMPTWIDPDSVTVPDYTLLWSDPGGLNGAVSFRLREIFGLTRTFDNAESASSIWTFDGFSSSTTRSYSGTKSYYSGTGDGLLSRLVSQGALTVLPADTIKARLWWDIETDWDYAYVEVSADGGQSWATLPGNVTTNADPNGTNRGNGITGFGGSGGEFVEGRFPLGAYSGQDVYVRCSYETDGFIFGEGFYVDDISPIIDFDSAVTLAAAIPSMSFPVTGKLPGIYQYDLRSTDQHGQQSATTPLHPVLVDYNTCACQCHIDPSNCDATQDITDVVATIGVAFRGAAAIPDPDSNCPYETTDTNCDDVTNVIDVVKMTNVAFRGADPATEFCVTCP